ncbi:MAG TPA: c-type cytochrome [Candidatus Sulfotelmatobacter sp.]|nr:c-type cytochrome [Candidatus Sulfotelmatobacter sp.]
MRKLVPAFVIVISLAALFMAACTGGKITAAYTVETGGDALRGAAVIDQYRCGACHYIPGIHDARGMVGPPLMFFAQRTFIAGEVPNSPENLVRWIRSPKSIEPGTAMPDLGLSDQEARDVAAYLYTLREEK